MANFNTNRPSQIQQVSSFSAELGVGLPVGLGTSQGAERLGLGLHDTRPANPSDNGIQFDPLSIRITLVIVFVTIFLVVILVIFVVVCLKRHRCIGRSRKQNSRNSGKDRLRSTRTRPRSDSDTRDNDDSLPRPRTVSNESDNSFMNDNEDYLHGVNYTSGTTELEKVSKKSYESRSQQPDIIEAEIHFVPSYHVYDYAYDHRIYGPSNEPIKVQCDKSNEPDVNCYRVTNEPLLHSPVSYHEHQDAQEAKRRNFVHHSLVLRSHLNSPPSNAPLRDIGIQGNDKGEHFQNTPLARLTPSTSSESPQHSVRILTLQDISRKQLQSVGLLLQSTSSSGDVSKDVVLSNSEMMSWNSPMVSDFSKWSSAPEASTEESSGVKNSPSDVLHSDNLGDDKIPPPIQHGDCSSTTTESDDDSFTGSEFGDDDGNRDAVTKTSNEVDHVDLACNIEPVAEVTSTTKGKLDTFPDTFSMMVSCDDCPAYQSSVPSLQSLEYLLNWGLNFESLMDVFQDLAELPDSETERPRNKQSAPSPSEIYV